MIESIIAILAALAGGLVWFIRRKASQHDDPATKHRRRYEQTDLDIASSDSPGAIAHGGADLDELDRLQRSKGGRGEPGPG